MQHISRGARRSSIRFFSRLGRAAPWRLLGGMGLWLGLAGAAQAQANWGPDPAFTATVGNNVFAIAPWVDGERVVVGGAFTTVSGAPHLRLARLNPNANGSLDASCVPAPGPNGSVRALAVRGWDSRMLIGGDFTEVDGVARNRIARLYDDCTLDGTFDPGTGANGTVSAVRMQGLSNVLIGGDFTEVNGVARNHIARLNADGTLDAFDPNVDGAVHSLAVQADGKILIGGSFNLVGGVVRRNIARLNADGTLDAVFAPALASAVHSIALLPGGDVLRAGFPFGSVDAVVRLKAADGASDPAFVPGTGPNGAVWAMAVQADGKILIGGDFTGVDGVARNRIARLNADGSLDGTFDPGTGADDSVYALTLHADGTVFLGGRFTQVNGQPGTARLARLMPAVAPVDGVCGAAHNPNSVPLQTSAPAVDLCGAGAPAGMAGGNSAWTWSCTGSNGGQPAACQAPRGYLVTPVVAAGGGVAPATPQTVAYGGTASFTITPTAGFVIDTVTSNCGGQLAGSVFTTGPVVAAGGCTVNATFVAAPATYPVTASASPVAGGTAMCAPSPVAHGGTATCTASAHAGYQFTGWTGDCVGQGSTCTLGSVTAARASVAQFGVVAPMGAKPIPTLSEWAMALLAAALGALSWGALRRRAHG